MTPQVLRDLAIEPGEYPLELADLRLAAASASRGLGYHGPDHPALDPPDRVRRLAAAAVRRAGRDATMSARSASESGWYVLDDAYRCRRLVGAGGTRCPVYRTLFRELAPRKEGKQAAVLEEEFAYDWQDGTCRLWFFEHGLPGYSWYVPKAGGHLNVGVGGMAQQAQGQGRRDPAALAGG